MNVCRRRERQGMAPVVNQAMPEEDQGLEGANPVATDPPITEDVEQNTDLLNRSGLDRKDADCGVAGLVADVPALIPFALDCGEGLQYLDRWYAQNEMKEMLQYSVACFIHDRFNSLLEMWKAGDLCKASDLDLILGNAQARSCNAGRPFVFACPVAASCFALRLLQDMAAEESWLRNLLVESRTPVFLPIFENAHYCSVFIDPRVGVAYWIDSLGIRDELAGKVALAFREIGFQVIVVREKWQLDSWSCGLWTTVLYHALLDFEEQRLHELCTADEWIRRHFLKHIRKWNTGTYSECLRSIHSATGNLFRGGMDTSKVMRIVYGNEPVEVNHVSAERCSNLLSADISNSVGKIVRGQTCEEDVESGKSVTAGFLPGLEEGMQRPAGKREMLGLLKQRFAIICAEHESDVGIDLASLLVCVRQQSSLDGLTDDQIRNAWYRWLPSLKKARLAKMEKRAVVFTCTNRYATLEFNSVSENCADAGGTSAAERKEPPMQNPEADEMEAEKVKISGLSALQDAVGEILLGCGIVNRSTVCTKLELLYLSEYSSLSKSHSKNSLQQAMHRWHKQARLKVGSDTDPSDFALPDLSEDVCFSPGLEDAVQMSLAIDLYYELKHSIPLPVLFKHVEQFCSAAPKSTWTPRLNGLLMKQVQKLKSEHSNLEDVVQHVLGLKNFAGIGKDLLHSKVKVLLPSGR